MLIKMGNGRSFTLSNAGTGYVLFKDVYGLTVLDYAKRYRYKEVIEILEKEKKRKHTNVLRGR